MAAAAIVVGDSVVLPCGVSGSNCRVPRSRKSSSQKMFSAFGGQQRLTDTPFFNDSFQILRNGSRLCKATPLRSSGPVLVVCEKVVGIDLGMWSDVDFSSLILQADSLNPPFVTVLPTNILLWFWTQFFKQGLGFKHCVCLFNTMIFVDRHNKLSSGSYGGWTANHCSKQWRPTNDTLGIFSHCGLSEEKWTIEHFKHIEGTSASSCSLQYKLLYFGTELQGAHCL